MQRLQLRLEEAEICYRGPGGEQGVLSTVGADSLDWNKGTMGFIQCTAWDTKMKRFSLIFSEGKGMMGECKELEYKFHYLGSDLVS